jgi:raffinose/stachyose/melibiose transport system permease protein
MSRPALLAAGTGTGETAGPVPAASRPRRTRYQWTALLYVAPAFAFLAAFVLFPLTRVVSFSFYDWSGAGEATWVGFGNYQRMLRSEQLHQALWHSLVFILTYSVLPIAIGLLLSGIIGRHRRRGLAFFRVVLFVPQVTTLVAVGVAWRWVYAESGTLNQLLGLAGIPADTAWLGSFTWALPAVGLIGTWVMSGFCMLLFLAGMGKIDASLYDAARIDGAGAVREFFTVTVPALRQEIIVAAVVTVIGALRAFDLVFVTTFGGPGHSTVVPGFLVYRLAFRAGDVGGAATVAVLLILMIFVLVLLITRLLRERP